MIYTQRWLTNILNYAIVYDETIDCSICKHIFLAIKFYPYIHGGVLDGFVLLRAVNDRKRFFLDKEHIE